MIEPQKDRAYRINNNDVSIKNNNNEEAWSR